MPQRITQGQRTAPQELDLSMQPQQQLPGQPHWRKGSATARLITSTAAWVVSLTTARAAGRPAKVWPAARSASVDMGSCAVGTTRPSRATASEAVVRCAKGRACSDDSQHVMAQAQRSLQDGRVCCTLLLQRWPHPRFLIATRRCGRAPRA